MPSGAQQVRVATVDGDQSVGISRYECAPDGMVRRKLQFLSKYLQAANGLAELRDYTSEMPARSSAAEAIRRQTQLNEDLRVKRQLDEGWVQVDEIVALSHLYVSCATTAQPGSISH